MLPVLLTCMISFLDAISAVKVFNLAHKDEEDEDVEDELLLFVLKNVMFFL